MNRIVAFPGKRCEALDPAAAYDVAAPCYDEWKWQRFWQHSESPVITGEVSAFAAELGGRGTLLDVGCGTGKYLQRLGGYFARAIGVDVSKRMLALAAKRALDKDLVHGDATSLPFPPAVADVVLSARMLSHVAEPRRAVQEMARVLRKDGLLILSDIAAEHDYEHTRLPTRQGSLFVQTYKHPFSELAEAIDGCGLTLLRSIPIVADARTFEMMERLKIRANGKLGWIALWRKGD